MAIAQRVGSAVGLCFWGCAADGAPDKRGGAGWPVRWWLRFAEGAAVPGAGAQRDGHVEVCVWVDETESLRPVEDGADAAAARGDDLRTVTGEHFGAVLSCSMVPTRESRPGRETPRWKLASSTTRSANGSSEVRPGQRPRRREGRRRPGWPWWASGAHVNGQDWRLPELQQRYPRLLLLVSAAQARSMPVEDRPARRGCVDSAPGGFQSLRAAAMSLSRRQRRR